MLTRKCDICGAEMRITTPRYKVIFDGWLYKSEKDICVPCFERIKAEIQTADTPQTDWEKEKSEKSLCNSCGKDCDNRKRNLYMVECNRYEPQTDCTWK